jgi:hypothetical protein
MPMMTYSAPAATSAVARCPHCDGKAKLTIVEPHLIEPHKEWHVFRCENCCTTRSYLTSR